MRRVKKLEASLLSYGFNVVRDDKFTQSDLMPMQKDKDVHGVFFAGHGGAGIIDLADFFEATYQDLGGQRHHNWAELYLYACETPVADAQTYARLVSEQGTLHYSTEKVRPSIQGPSSLRKMAGNPMNIIRR